MNTVAQSSLAVAALCVSLATVPQVAHCAEESFTVIGRFNATPGREDELEARLQKTAEYVRINEPTATYRLHRSLKDPAVFVYYQRYPSQAVFVHFETVVLPASRKAFGALAEGILARPVEYERFNTVVE